MTDLDLKGLIDELVKENKPALGTTSMSASEVGGPTDPLRRIEWPISGLPRGAKIWSQRDPAKQVHHITLEADGLQAHISVTEQVLATAGDINDMAKAIVNDLCDELGITPDREKALKAIGLAYWKYVLETAVREHALRLSKQPEHCFITPAAYSYIRDCKDDLAGGGEKQKQKRKSNAYARLNAIMPKGMHWEVQKPAEGAHLVAMTVK